MSHFNSSKPRCQIVGSIIIIQERFVQFEVTSTMSGRVNKKNSDSERVNKKSAESMPQNSNQATAPIYQVEGKCPNCNRSYQFISTSHNPNRDCVDCGKKTSILGATKEFDNYTWNY